MGRVKIYTLNFQGPKAITGCGRAYRLNRTKNVEKGIFDFLGNGTQGKTCNLIGEGDVYLTETITPNGKSFIKLNRTKKKHFDFGLYSLKLQLHNRYTARKKIYLFSWNQIEYCFFKTIPLWEELTTPSSFRSDCLKNELNQIYNVVETIVQKSLISQEALLTYAANYGTALRVSTTLFWKPLSTFAKLVSLQSSLNE